MIAISKSEKEAINELLPNVHVVRTMKQKSKRHHYYCEETLQVLRLLSQLRDGTVRRRVERIGENYGYPEKKR